MLRRGYESPPTRKQPPFQTNTAQNIINSCDDLFVDIFQTASKGWAKDFRKGMALFESTIRLKHFHLPAPSRSQVWEPNRMVLTQTLLRELCIPQRHSDMLVCKTPHRGDHRLITLEVRQNPYNSLWNEKMLPARDPNRSFQSTQVTLQKSTINIADWPIHPRTSQGTPQ